ncbi:MAG TPA: FAD-dependent monooxygenase [Ktedonosporobacter sp.]|nr:FAD-dependent monooxygenase [Ktedonosporobacter sp.]
MKIVILGGGPAGLYSGLLIKKANPRHEITIIERNPADITYGWGVVFSDRTLGSFQRADYKTYEQITNHFVIWDAIDVHYRGETIRCGGHVIASIARKRLLNILQKRCEELGVILQFNCELDDLATLGEYDLLIAADGLNSLVRRTFAAQFQPSIEPGKARYIWLGADKVLDAFTFIFQENAHGLFQVHAYPFSGTTSTFIIECDESSWLNAGLDKADEATSLAYCEQLLADHLAGSRLLSNNSRWINFPTLKTKSWQYQRMVLLGDAAHTAHFSIGSGTKLAMEDAIALAGALEQYPDIATALNEYEVERKPVVEVFQRAAQESRIYFETIKRYLGLEPMPFAFQLLTRSGRISYDDLKLRDPHFGDAVDRWWAQKAQGVKGQARHSIIAAPPPMFTPLCIRDLTLSNRVVLSPPSSSPAPDGQLSNKDTTQIARIAQGEAGLILTEQVAVSSAGRISPESIGLYTAEHQAAWTRIVDYVHSHSGTKIALQLGHAGRRGSTRPRTQGLDRPLREGNWPLLSASPIPYTPISQVPRAMEQSDMEQVCEEFVRATEMARAANFDMLQLNFAHGYLLASFISPLTNRRSDEYGGNMEQRMRFPLTIFDAVRSTWPQDKPICVALSLSDGARDGLSMDDAVLAVKLLQDRGCDMIEVLAGQTTIESELTYSRGFLTALSDQIRNKASMPTLVGGYLTTSNEINTVIAAGRAELCILSSPLLKEQENHAGELPDLHLADPRTDVQIAPSSMQR